MDDDMKRLLIQLLRPLAISIVLFTVAGILFSLDHGEDSIRELGFAVMATLLVIIGAGVLIFPAGRFLSTVLDRLLYPVSQDKAPPNFKLAEWYYQQERYDEALAEFTRLHSEHPDRWEGYAGLIKLYCLVYQDRAEADRVYELGTKKLTDAEAQQALYAYFEAVLAGEPPPLVEESPEDKFRPEGPAL